MRHRIAALVLPVALTGCVDFSEPAEGARVTAAALAVDDRTETTFVLARAASPDAPEEQLLAVDPDTGRAARALDLTGRDDARLLFPEPGVLVLSSQGGADRLDLLDAATLELVGSREAGARLQDPRMSPSRRWIAVTEGPLDHGPLQVLDAAAPDLAAHPVPHDGARLEARFLHGADRLLAIVFHDVGSPWAWAHIVAWSMDQVEANGFQVDASGLWADPYLDVIVSGVGPAAGFSPSWIGVSPDDRRAVFPLVDVEQGGPYAHELIVVDMETGDLQKVSAAQGPVGFTPDGSTIVARSPAGEPERLLLVDAETLEVDPQDVPIDGAFQYLVCGGGNFVLVASSAGDARLVLYDVDAGLGTQMPGPGVDLARFAARDSEGELWLVDGGTLFRLGVEDGSLTALPTAFTPEHVAYLPDHDTLVFDDAGSSKLFFWDPDTLRTVRTADLAAAE